MTWSEGEVRDLCRGRDVKLLDRLGAPTDGPHPAFLASLGAGPALGAAASEGASWREWLGHLAPDDLGPVLDAWSKAMQAAGEVVGVRCRLQTEGMWHQARLEFLNLLDDPAFDALILTTVVDEPAAAPDGAGPRAAATPWAVITIDDQGCILTVEGTVEEVYGATRDGMVGRSALEFVHPDDIAACVAANLEAVLPGAEGRSVAHRVIRPDGSMVWVEVTMVNQMAAHGHVLLLVLDVTDKRARADALAASKAEAQALAEDFRLLADQVPTGVFRADASGRVLFANQRWSELTSAYGPVRDLREVGDRDGWALIDEVLARMPQDDDAPTRSIEVRTPTGRTYSLSWRAVRREHGSYHLVGALDDVTDTALLRERVNRDALTGVLNRRGFDEALAVADDLDAEALLVFVDLDDFKTVNDRYGHEAGDVVVRHAADRLLGCIRPGDHLARFGGDEFVICFRHVPVHLERELVRRIAGALDLPVLVPGGSWRPSASIGTARPGPDDDMASLIRRADIAMYEVKQAGSRRRHGTA